MARYVLILLAAACCLAAVTGEEDGPLTAFARLRLQAILANTSLRRLLFVAGALLIALLAWQVVGFDFAFVFGGEALAYLEITTVLFIAAARTRLRLR